MRQLSATQLQAWLADPQRDKPVLFDVREPWEFETCRIAGSLSMPMRGIPARYHELKKDSDIVMVPYEEAYENGFEDMNRRIPDLTRINEAMGWKPERKLDDILSDVIEFTRSPSETVSVA